MLTSWHQSSQVECPEHIHGKMQITVTMLFHVSVNAINVNAMLMQCLDIWI